MSCSRVFASALLFNCCSWERIPRPKLQGVDSTDDDPTQHQNPQKKKRSTSLSMIKWLFCPFSVQIGCHCASCDDMMRHPILVRFILFQVTLDNQIFDLDKIWNFGTVCYDWSSINWLLNLNEKGDLFWMWKWHSLSFQVLGSLLLIRLHSITVGILTTMSLLCALKPIKVSKPSIIV